MMREMLDQTARALGWALVLVALGVLCALCAGIGGVTW